jgi:hypothetical protein
MNCIIFVTQIQDNKHHEQATTSRDDSQRITGYNS